MASGRIPGTGRQPQYIKHETPLGSYWTKAGDDTVGYLVNPLQSSGAIAYPIEYINWILHASTPTAQDVRPAVTGQQGREIGGQALNGKIGIAYGRVRVGPSVFFGPRNLTQNAIVVGYGLSHGPCSALNDIVFQNGMPLADMLSRGAFSYSFFPGELAPAAPYAGFVNSQIGSTTANFERFPGLCYVGAQLNWQGPPNDFLFSGMMPYPLPLFDLNGRLVRNYATGLDVFTDNPAYCLADYITSIQYGRTAKINVQSVIDAAAYCDETFTNTAYAVGDPLRTPKKHTLNYFLLREASHKSHMDAIRAHFRCSVIERGGEFVFTIDKDKSPSMTFSEAEAVPVSIERMGSSGVPNHVVVSGPDKANNYKTTEQHARTAALEAGLVTEKPAAYELEGTSDNVHRASEAFYLLNTRLNNLRVVLRAVHPKAMALEPLDVIAYTTASFGMSGFLLRVLRVTRNPDGTAWMIECAGHDPAIYAFQSRTIETFPLPTLPAPSSPEPPEVVKFSGSEPYWDAPPIRARIVRPSGSWTSSGNLTIWDATKIQDGDKAAPAAQFNTTADAWIAVDLGTAQVVREIVFRMSVSVQPFGSLVNAMFVVEYSDTSATGPWTGVVGVVPWGSTGTSHGTMADERTVINHYDGVTDGGAHRYWRFRKPAPNPYTETLNDIEIITFTGATYQFVAGYRIRGWKSTPFVDTGGNISIPEYSGGVQYVDVLFQPTATNSVKDVVAPMFTNYLNRYTDPVTGSTAINGGSETQWEVATISTSGAVSEYRAFYQTGAGFASSTAGPPEGALQHFVPMAARDFVPVNGVNNDVDAYYTTDVLRLAAGSVSADFSIGGILRGTAGRLLIVFNDTAYRATLKHEGTGSTAAARLSFSLQAGAFDQFLAAGETCWLWYDATASRWKPVREIDTIRGETIAAVTSSAHGTLSLYTPYDGTGVNALDFLYDNALPAARIAARLTGAGADFYFGISQSYVAGITDIVAVLDHTGTLFVKGASGATRLDAGATGAPYLQWDQGGTAKAYHQWINGVGLQHWSSSSHEFLAAGDVYSNVGLGGFPTAGSGHLQIFTGSGVAAFIGLSINAAFKGYLGSCAAANDLAVGAAIGDMVIRTNGGGAIVFSTDSGSTLALALSAKNLSFGPAGPFGSGSRVIGVQNCVTAPSINPSGGGVLYANGGALIWLGSSGTFTTMGAADPHCPNCGGDVNVQESVNSEHGYQAICLFCLGEFLEQQFGDLPFIVQTDSPRRGPKNPNAAKDKKTKKVDALKRIEEARLGAAEDTGGSTPGEVPAIDPAGGNRNKNTLRISGSSNRG